MMGLLRGRGIWAVPVSLLSVGLALGSGIRSPSLPDPPRADQLPAGAVGIAVLGVPSAPHGRMALHPPLVLPARGPYGARSDRRYLPVYQRPHDPFPRIDIDTENPLGQRFRLPVRTIERDPDGSAWLRVLLPGAQLGRTGWVRSDDIHVVTLTDRLVVDLSSFTLRHYRNGRLIDTFRVGVGRPEFPTPTGTYFIWARVPEGMPDGPYGVFALGTSAFSSVIEDGRVGIHGTANPADRGQRVSHGCIRVYNTDMVKLEHVPLGTPLIIRG